MYPFKETNWLGVRFVGSGALFMQIFSPLPPKFLKTTRMCFRVLQVHLELKKENFFGF